MIDSVGRIVFPTSLFGRPDPVIYDGTNPCLIHTSAAERGYAQEAGDTGDGHSTFLPQIFYQDGTAELRFMSSGLYIGPGHAKPASCSPANPETQSSVRAARRELRVVEWFNYAFTCGVVLT